MHTNPYKAKRVWPPDFSKLSHKHQFRIERRYRRRAKLKWARPRWTKFVKLATWASMIFVGVYGVLFLDPGNGEKTPFDPVGGIREDIERGPSDSEQIRKWYRDTIDSVWSRRAPEQAQSPQAQIQTEQ
ncbi:hypothetical protein LTR66_013793 [Elasticomyces elasticus]|nr:hypothetical protein LTR66_013793 [Elasticomyces elasticus]KAK4984554.1 hypothetical protein LTR50_006518 [Elasticomyces elasticus]